MKLRLLKSTFGDAGSMDFASLDPDLRAAARVLPRGYGLRRSLAPQRALMKLAAAPARIRTIPVTRVDDHVTVRVHRPAELPDRAPALLWVHGGGTVMGTAAQDDPFCRKLSHIAGVAVASVEHRLAPEHPYPTPLDDCYAALQWLARQPWVDTTRIAVGGASAGGLFAAALAQRAHDRGDVLVAYQMLAYPMLDNRTAATPQGNTYLMWSERDNQQAWQWYLDGADPLDAAPGRRPDLTGLPPAWIGVGTLDLYYDECRDYAQRLRNAGVAVHEEIAPGAFHAFDLLAVNAPISLRFFASQCHHLREALHT